MCSNLAAQGGACLPQAGLRNPAAVRRSRAKATFAPCSKTFARDVSLHVEYIVIRDIARNQPAGVTICPLGGSNTGIPNRSEEDTNDCGLASVVPRFVGCSFSGRHLYRCLQKETYYANSTPAAS